MNNSDISNPNKPPSLCTPSWVFITPEMARGLISTSNRRIRPALVRDYKRKMEAGLWHFSPHGVTLSADGTVCDGNHRMHALSEANVPGVWFLVADWRMDFKELRVDIGGKRSLSDYSQAPTWVIETITALAKIRFDENRGNDRMDPTEMEKAYSAFGAEATKLFAACTASSKVRSTSYVRAGFVAAMIGGENEDEMCEQYREFVLNGAGRKPSLVSLSRQVETMRMDRVELLARTYVAATGLNSTRTLIRSIDNVMDEIKDVLVRRIKSVTNK